MREEQEWSRSEIFDMTLDDKARKLSEEEFIGFQPEHYECGGREQFIYLLRAGLMPDSKVVDIGCGVLRAGYWLIHFLNPGCYFGIEPHEGRLENGKLRILEEEVLAAKVPKFDTNPDFNTSVFGEKFDFFLAYSIWTHAAKWGIEATLDSFVRDAKPGAVFLTTYLPANEEHPDYDGDTWVGSSHESMSVGCIHHSTEWVEEQCAKRELTMERLPPDLSYRMSWLAIRKAEA